MQKEIDKVNRDASLHRIFIIPISLGMIPLLLILALIFNIETGLIFVISLCVIFNITFYTIISRKYINYILKTDIIESIASYDIDGYPITILKRDFSIENLNKKIIKHGLVDKNNVVCFKKRVGFRDMQSYAYPYTPLMVINVFLSEKDVDTHINSIEYQESYNILLSPNKSPNSVLMKHPKLNGILFNTKDNDLNGLLKVPTINFSSRKLNMVYRFWYRVLGNNSDLILVNNYNYIIRFIKEGFIN